MYINEREKYTDKIATGRSRYLLELSVIHHRRFHSFIFLLRPWRNNSGTLQQNGIERRHLVDRQFLRGIFFFKFQHNSKDYIFTPEKTNRTHW